MTLEVLVQFLTLLTMMFHSKFLKKIVNRKFNIFTKNIPLIVIIGYHLPDDEVNGGCFCSLLVVASILDWSSSLEMVELHSEATVRLDSGRPVKTEKIINQKLL